MNAKRAGLISGAALGGLAVWGFYAVTNVSDGDRLTQVLRDHCLPYVNTGATPFQNLGRAPGVYDDLPADDTMTNGGLRILYDGRFWAQWGEARDLNSAIRVCRVDDTYQRADSKGFEVHWANLPTFMTDTLPADLGLILHDDPITPPPRLHSWSQSDTLGPDGLRVIMTTQTFGVSNLLVVDDLPE